MEDAVIELMAVINMIVPITTLVFVILIFNKVKKIEKSIENR